MAELIYPTSTTHHGPWLIDRDDLQSFDSILDQEWDRLFAVRERVVEEETEKTIEDDADRVGRTLSPEERKVVEKRVRKLAERKPYLFHRDFREKRSINVYLKDSRKIEVSSFAEALRHPELMEEVSHRFDLRLECGEVSCNMDLNGNLLSVRVSPESNPLSREVFVSLQQWIETIRPPRWLYLWNKFIILPWVVWLAVVFSIVLTASDPKEQAKKVYQAQAHEILKEGLTEGEQLKAIETLLALQSEYAPSPHVSTPAWFYFLFIGGFCVCVASSILPKAVLGIGKGQDRINSWRVWLQALFVIVPGFIFANVIWPWLSKRLGQ